jgi:hypothetical protein
VLEAYKGTIMLRVQPEQLQAYLLKEATTTGAPVSATPAQSAASALAEPMWIIDPHANLILQYPANAQPEKVRKDISKLVYHSRIG